MSLQLHTTYCISLGPGNPEHMTLEALSLLKKSDLIYCPSTIIQGKQKSRSLDLLLASGISSDQVVLFHVPMTKDRSQPLAAYQEIALQIEEKYREGLKISFVAEGDAGIYSTAHYIMDLLLEKGVSCKQIAGIPAFIACGALASLHIIQQEESLMVWSGNITTAKIEQYLNDGITLVFMKTPLHEAEIKEAIRSTDRTTWHYFENVGVQEREFYTSDVQEILAKDFPYFSIIIAKKQ